ncbi:MAG: YlxR family protein [Dehalococcoidia bacterium]|nr:YlxR family protein [Dehalococcoidia bacterium]
MCVACGRKQEKRTLLRVVRTPQGALELDEKGKKPGRGAYLCGDHTCWESALQRKRLEHALRMTLTAQDKQLIKAQASRLAAAPDSGS